MKRIACLLTAMLAIQCAPHPAAKSGTRACPGAISPQKGAVDHRGRARKALTGNEAVKEPKKVDKETATGEGLNH